MKILVTYHLSSKLVESGLGDLVVYRPDLGHQPESALLRTLLAELPDVVLVSGRAPGPATVTAWRDSARRPVQWIRCQPGDTRRAIDLPGVSVDRVNGTPGNRRDDLQALGLAERSIMRSLTKQRLSACGISPQGSGALSGSRVTLVGAGIVNLMTAFDLSRQGAEIEILEASPDPRDQPPWQQMGTTHGGDNARMFCFTEADNYNLKARPRNGPPPRLLCRTIAEGGWLAVEPEQLSVQEQSWIQRFLALPRWRAEVFAEDIRGFTIASEPLWHRLRQSAAHLFEGVGYTKDVLQLYTRAEDADAAEALHSRLGSLKRAVDVGALNRRHPALGDAVAEGEIAQGLEVRGFSLNIHDFVDRLLADLEDRSVRLRWNTRATEIERAADGQVAGLRTRNTVSRTEHIVRSEHYVLSPGVYGNDVLEGTRAAGKIQGMLGLWLSFPDLEPRPRHAIKLHREGHVGEDSNIIPATDASGRPVLLLGSGYGYLGNHPLDMDSPQIARLFEGLEETARRYFPRAHAEAARDGTLDASRKACVRPFTATSLGIFDVSATAEGGRMIIASGHNTGGFAQAPAVAEAVTATLEGKPHAMQSLYDPERGISRARHATSGSGAEADDPFILQPAKE